MSRQLYIEDNFSVAILTFGYKFDINLNADYLMTIIIIIIIELYLPTVLFHYKIKTIYKDESDLPIGRALKYLQVNIIGKLQKI